MRESKCAAAHESSMLSESARLLDIILDLLHLHLVPRNPQQLSNLCILHYYVPFTQILLGLLLSGLRNESSCTARGACAALAFRRLLDRVSSSLGHGSRFPLE